MYAVLFDLDTNCLGENYEGSTYNNAYKQVKDVRMLRIEENNDLSKAL